MPNKQWDYTLFSSASQPMPFSLSFEPHILTASSCMYKMSLCTLFTESFFALFAFCQHLPWMQGSDDQQLGFLLVGWQVLLCECWNLVQRLPPAVEKRKRWCKKTCGDAQAIRITFLRCGHVLITAVIEPDHFDVIPFRRSFAVLYRSRCSPRRI